MVFKGLQEFFSYTKDQRRGIYALTILVILLLAGLYVDDYFYPNTEQDQQRLADFKREKLELEKKEALAWQEALQPFNPNTCPKATWVALGFGGSLADRIANYLAKGGRFYQPEDLFKIYGIDSARVAAVLPYVKIEKINKGGKPSGYEPQKSKPLKLKPFNPNTIAVKELEQMGLKPWQAKNFENFRTKYRPFRKDSDVFKVYGVDSALASQLINYVTLPNQKTEETATAALLVEINTADSLELLKVKGIGPYTAQKILAQRAKLGGFYSTQQLLGLYPINETRFKKIAPQLTCNAQVKTLNINSATFKELVRHPYLTYDMVKGIVHFRENIRPFKTVNEVQNIELFTAENFPKIAPYLRVD
jgi:DNA uptake protein ComE-like DNA-binding protein